MAKAMKPTATRRKASKSGEATVELVTTILELQSLDADGNWLELDRKEKLQKFVHQGVLEARKKWLAKRHPKKLVK